MDGSILLLAIIGIAGWCWLGMAYMVRGGGGRR